MAATSYSYTISTAFPSAKVDTTRLTSEIVASSISSATLQYINTDSVTCDIWFSDALSGADQTNLNGLVAAHTGNPPDVTQAASEGVPRAPTTADDSTKGVVLGDVWLDTQTNQAYVCVANTAGAAVWKITTADAVSPTRDLVAGSGLTGGGDLTQNRTFNVGANADGSIAVNANDIQVGILATDAQHGSRGGAGQHAVATTSVNGFFASTDKTKLDGIASGAQVCNWTNVASALGGQAGVHAGYIFKSNGSGGGSMVTPVPKITHRLTVGQAGDDVDYTSIATAVGVAIAGGAAVGNYWEIVVYPGTYLEPPFTIQDGILLTSDTGSSVQPIYVAASNPSSDLITCTGGAITGFNFMGVTDPTKCIFRCATAGTLTYFQGITVLSCSNGWLVSNGAIALINTLSFIVGASGQEVNTIAYVTGANSSIELVTAYIYIPSAVLPLYTTNPLQTAFKASNSANMYLSGGTFQVADLDGTSDVIFADTGAVVTVLAAKISNSNYAFHIGASGSNTKISVNATLDNNVRNVKIDSSTGKVYTSLNVDQTSTSVVTGGAIIGTVSYRNNGNYVITGDADYRYVESGVSVDLADFFYDQNSTGVCDGGAVTAGTGLQVNVAAGEGWIRRTSTYKDTFSVTWSGAAVTLTASATNYVYYDSVSTSLVAATSVPSETGILLATVVTSGSGIRFLHKTRTLLTDVQGSLQSYLQSVSPQYLKSGLAATQGSTATKLSVGSGSYYLGLDLVSYAGSGGDASWSYFYGTNGATEVSGVTAVNTTQYDSAGTLTAMTASYFRCDYLVLTSDGRLSLIYGNTQYATLPLAEAGNPASIPTYLLPSNMPLAKVYVQQGVGISTIVDARPTRSTGGSGSGGVTVHSALAGLNADDHTQYLLASGSRSMGGDLNMGGHAITNVGNVDGVDVSAHASRHNPGGADALTTGLPVAISVGASPSAGTGSSYALNDHQHGITTGTPGSVGTANAAGTASTVSRSDHVHDHGSQTTSTHHAVATTSANGFLSSTDKTKLDGIAASAAALTSTAPSDVTKAVAAVGVATTAARSDHKHDVSTAVTGAATPGDSAAEGTATSLARSDHRHSLPAFGSTGTTFCVGNDSRLSDDRTTAGLRSATTVVGVSAATAPSSGQVLTATSTTAATWQTPTVYANVTSTAPSDVTKAVAAVGVATTAARSDHKHDVSTAVTGAATPGDSAAEGTATSLARSDHKHSLPAFGTTGTTFCVGNDSRLSDDRTASGLRSASTTVAVSAATAPSAGQVLTATSSTAATWQAPSSGHGDFAAGGDAAGANRTLGNTTSYDLAFITNNVTRLTITAAGNVTAAGRLASNTYVLGSGPDLSLLPVVGGQSVITSWHGLQLVGAKQSTVEYTPSNVGSADEACVIIPCQNTTSTGLLIRNYASQTADSIQIQGSTGAELASFGPNGWLNIAGTTTPFTNSILFLASGNSSYLQSNLQNTSSGTSASTDICCTADTGSDSTNYTDLGINSSTYSDAAYTISGPLDSYLTAYGGDLILGTGVATHAIKFHTGGTLAANLRATLSDTGLAMNSLPIGGLANPSLDQDAVTKYYADSRFGSIHEPCLVATTANITLSATQTIDGVAVAAGNRVLVKNQSTASANGIYVVASGAWTRSLDLDSSTDATRGVLVYVQTGTVNGNTNWALTTLPPITLGTTSLTFALLGVSTTAPANITKATASAGTSNYLARIDHKHDITTAAPSTLAAGGSNTEGNATSLARSNHIHALPAYGTASGTFCQGNDARLSDVRTASGIKTATTTVAVSTATAPTTGQVLTATSSTAATWQTVTGSLASTTPATLVVGGAGAVGVGTTSARADHVHPMPAFGTGSGTFCQGNDARLSDTRVASGLASATTTVAVSTATAPSTGQVLMATSSTAATWQTPAGSGGIDTFSVALINAANLNVYDMTSTWGGLVSPKGQLVINSLVCWVYQSAASGSVQGAIYNAATNALVASTTTTLATSTGLKTMTFSSPVTLTGGTPYYLAVSCTANGALLCGNNSALSTFNLSPKPSFIQNNSRLPATLSPNASSSLVWLQANA